MYQSIAKFYDQIFPVSDQKVSFLKEKFYGKKKLLDIGCATGGYVNSLTAEGFIMHGIDLDQEMIKIAKAKYPNLNFEVKNMLSIGNEKYDGIYCIGNSLVHLENIDKALKLMYQSLYQNGKLIIQIVNYDRILNQKIKSLPTIKNSLTFTRSYEIKENTINFKTTLTIDNKEINNSTTLYPIKVDVLVNILKKYFQTVKTFDGFSNKPFNPSKSFALVVIAS